MPCEPEVVLERLLRFHWLRPEVALLMTHSIVALGDLVPQEPSADLAGGDGTFSLAWAGGELASHVDMYQSTAPAGEFFSGIDVFDYCDPAELDISVRKKPRWTFTYNVDVKAWMLEKSKFTGMYSMYVLHDLMNPLPFPEESLQNVWSNTLYAIDNYRQRIIELGRILRPGGELILEVSTPALRDAQLYGFYERYGWQWIKDIDRGRGWIQRQTARPRAHYEECLQAAGLELVEWREFMPDVIYRIYDIGLRPLFPALITMYKALDRTSLDRVRKQWVETLFFLLQPFLRTDWMEEAGLPPVHAIIRARRPTR